MTNPWKELLILNGDAKDFVKNKNHQKTNGENKMTIELFHGSNDENFQGINANHANDVFNGVFSSARSESASSHGKYIFKTEIEERRLLTSYYLNYDVDYQEFKKAFDSVNSYLKNQIDIEQLRDAVQEDKDSFLWDILEAEDCAEASWEIQRIRGQVAKALGFDAVEMNDEHGTSYLIVNENIKFEKI